MSDIHIGLSENSEEREKIIIQNENTAVRYFVQEETIDLEALRMEKASLEQLLNIQRPSDEELIEIGKMQHPYFQDRTYIENRINEINKILGEE